MGVFMVNCGKNRIVVLLILASLMIGGCTQMNQPKRYGSVIRVRPEKLDEYKRLHAAVWPEVLKMIKECNISNYSIFYRDGFLFSYLEYTGNDFAADMAKMAADPTTQRWWAVCKPCQQPVDSARPDEWWADMESVFHLD